MRQLTAPWIELQLTRDRLPIKQHHDSCCFSVLGLLLDTQTDESHARLSYTPSIRRLTWFAQSSASSRTVIDPSTSRRAHQARDCPRPQLIGNIHPATSQSFVPRIQQCTQTEVITAEVIAILTRVVLVPRLLVQSTNCPTSTASSLCHR